MDKFQMNENETYSKMELNWKNIEKIFWLTYLQNILYFNIEGKEVLYFERTN